MSYTYRTGYEAEGLPGKALSPTMAPSVGRPVAASFVRPSHPTREIDAGPSSRAIETVTDSRVCPRAGIFGVCVTETGHDAGCGCSSPGLSCWCLLPYGHGPFRPTTRPGFGRRDPRCRQ